MSKRIGLVSCVKSKRESPAPARDLYVSPLFRSFRSYAEELCDDWFILSAKYGLLRPDEIVAPYDKTLNRMRKPERLEWASRVSGELLKVLPHQAHLVVLASVRYRENLLHSLRRAGHTVEVPLEGLPLGKQLQTLRELGFGSVE